MRIITAVKYEFLANRQDCGIVQFSEIENSRNSAEVEHESFWRFVVFCIFFLVLIGTFAAYGAWGGKG